MVSGLDGLSSDIHDVNQSREDHRKSRNRDVHRVGIHSLPANVRASRAHPVDHGPTGRTDGHAHFGQCDEERLE